jgi:pSer/pThr/pTyr-binding forkhead associated (FHA) protein
VFKNNQYKVKDNNSTNGIKLNGRKIKESVIKHADIIEIADLSFTFYE